MRAIIRSRAMIHRNGARATSVNWRGKALPKAFRRLHPDTLLNIELPPLREGDKANSPRVQFSKDGPK